MSANRIVIKYHHRRMILTVDLNTLFEVVFKAYGDGVTIEFLEMDEGEKMETTEDSGTFGIRIVRERFWILETVLPNSTTRRKDLEQMAIRPGQK